MESSRHHIPCKATRFPHNATSEHHFIGVSKMIAVGRSDNSGLPTQRNIAGILSAYDNPIENTLRRLKIQEEIVQALYREWFVPRPRICLTDLRRNLGFHPP